MAIPRNLANLANQLDANGNPPKVQVGDTSVTVTDTGSNGTISFTTDNTVKATIDNAGNLTINGQGDLRLADADSSNYVALQAPATVASNVTWTLPNADGTTGQVLSTNGSGTLSWVAAGGSSNSISQLDSNVTVTDTGSNGTIAFTTDNSERMRVTSAGNVGIGTSSPEVFSGYTTLQIQGTTTSTGGIFQSATSDNSVKARFFTNNNGGLINVATNHNLLFLTNATERMRLTSNGNLCVNSSTSSGSLFFGGAGIDDTTLWNDAIFEAVFNNNGTTSGSRYGFKVTGGLGNNGIPYGVYSDVAHGLGSTTYGGYFKATGAYNSQFGVWNGVNKDLGAYTSAFCNYANIQTSSSGGAAYFYFGYDETGGATRFYVRQNGGISNYQANDTNLSDRREKKDFAPAKNYLETICQIPVQTFKYIDQLDDAPTLGVVAQDVQAVAPELVNESNWAGPDQEEKVRLSIYQTDLQYALMKCIQELKAELDAVKSELQILKEN